VYANILKQKIYSKEVGKMDHGKGTFLFYETKIKIIADWFNAHIMKENARHNGKPNGWNTIKQFKVIIFWIEINSKSN
jgi:hypothetical protein